MLSDFLDIVIWSTRDIRTSNLNFNRLALKTPRSLSRQYAVKDLTLAIRNLLHSKVLYLLANVWFWISGCGC